MRDFFALLNEYPWTAIFCFLGLIILIACASMAIEEIVRAFRSKGDKS